MVRHKCGVPLCCNVNHHELGTAAENSQDRRKHGTYLEGEAGPSALLRETQVRDIYDKVIKGQDRKLLAKHYGVSVGTINHIAAGLSWTHLNLKPIDGFVVGEKSHYAKLSEVQVREIHSRYSKGSTAVELAREYNVTEANVRLIAAGRTWRHLNLGRVIKRS